MASFASSATTGGARKHTWTNIFLVVGSTYECIRDNIFQGISDIRDIRCGKTFLWDIRYKDRIFQTSLTNPTLLQ